MESNIKIITGKVEENPYGNWSDCDTGIFIDSDKVESIFRQYKGKTVRVTIEEIKEAQ